MTSPATISVKESLNDPITLHMRTDMALLQADQSIGEALAAVREKPPEGRIIYFYVIDSENRLKGVIPTRRLLLSDPSSRVGDIMIREVITLPQHATVLDACQFFILHRLLAFPVIDKDRRLVGAVDVELYTRELTQIDITERNDELFQLIGVHIHDAERGSPWKSFRSRFPWLLTNITGGIMAAFLTGFFEAELIQVVALSMFIPVVLALSESVSIQSLSLTLQSPHGQRPDWRTLLRLLRVEFCTGILLGSACAFVIGLVAYAWQRDPRVVICLWGGIGGGVTIAAVLGVAVPSLLQLFRKEPQVAAGPIALACTDLITLTFYFSLARYVLR